MFFGIKQTNKHINKKKVSCLVYERGVGLSVVTIVTVADLPMMAGQIMDSCHSLVLSGLCEAPVTLKQ